MESVNARTLNSSFRDMTVKVLRLDDMNNTIFRKKRPSSCFEGTGVEFVEKASQADIAVASSYGPVTPLRCLFLQLYNRKRLKFLIWTDEPRQSTFTNNKITGKGIIPDLHVMNCYTNDIYFNNYYHCNWGMRRRAKEIDTKTPLTTRKIVILTRYISDSSDSSLKINGKEVDLGWLRCHIALEGHKIGLVDIYGKGWPSGVSKEDSRRVDDFVQRKMNILSNYRFNICFENTIYPNYCTEKIWHSIEAGCLPVYYGSGTSIYDDFPPNSFLDYSELGSPSALFDKVLHITEEEYRHRFNLCVQTYNRIYDSDDITKTRATYVNNTVYKLHSLAHNFPN